MEKTIKLYDFQPYSVSFDALVVSAAPGREPNTADVILDKTLFFPEEGGQTPDRGTLLGRKVLDVQIREDVITHTLEGDAVPAPGSSAHGQIDWEHRYSNMQNHSGEHILSGLLHSIYGYENVGFRLSDSTVTLDTSGVLSPEQIRDLERRANAVIWENVPITCEYPSPEVLRTLDYRSKKEITGPIRIVTIEGYDVCACCAPHVRHTGEIGLIHILSAERTKTQTRLFFVCGKRALYDMESRMDALEEVSHLTNEPQENTPAGVQRLLDEISSQRETIRNLRREKVEAKLAALKEKNAGADLSAQSIWFFEQDIDMLTQRYFMNSLCDMGYRFAGVFVGNDTDGYKYLIGSRKDNANIPNRVLREKLSAKGGGKPEMVQGSIHSAEQDILAALGELPE